MKEVYGTSDLENKEGVRETVTVKVTADRGRLS
jgi:hypothetical protein